MKSTTQLILPTLALSALALILILSTGSASAKEVLPFPEPPMGGKVEATMQESVHKWRAQPCHLLESDRLPEGEVTIAYEMHTPPGRGVPAELKFWINGKNFHSQADSIWQSHKNGPHRSLWFLAMIANIIYCQSVTCTK